MKLLVATRSPGKQAEVRALFEGSGIEVVFPEQVGVAASQAVLADQRRDAGGAQGLPGSGGSGSPCCS